MAWIKTQAGILYDCDFVKTHRVFVFGGSGVCEDELGVYNGPEIAKTVLGDIERWIMLGADGVFTMPDKDYAKCGAGFKSYMAAGIDVEKAAESIRKTDASMEFMRDHRSQTAEEDCGPMVTTFPIPDSVMHFDFLSHNGKNVVGVSFDKATNIVSVEFDEPDVFNQFAWDYRSTPTAEDPIEKCCNTCGNVFGAPACIGCIEEPVEHRNWRPRSGK